MTNGLAAGEKSGGARHGAAANISLRVLKLLFISCVQVINLLFLTSFKFAALCAKPGKIPCNIQQILKMQKAPFHWLE